MANFYYPVRNCGAVKGSRICPGTITEDKLDESLLEKINNGSSGGGSSSWGSITGNIQNQTDLINLLGTYATKDEIPDVSNFVTENSLTTQLAGFVTLNTAQTISGLKTFSTNVNVMGDVVLQYNAQSPSQILGNDGNRNVNLLGIRVYDVAGTPLEQVEVGSDEAQFNANSLGVPTVDMPVNADLDAIYALPITGGKHFFMLYDYAEERYQKKTNTQYYPANLSTAGTALIVPVGDLRFALHNNGGTIRALVASNIEGQSVTADITRKGFYDSAIDGAANDSVVNYTYDTFSQIDAQILSSTNEYWFTIISFPTESYKIEAQVSGQGARTRLWVTKIAETDGYPVPPTTMALVSDATNDGIIQND